MRKSTRENTPKLPICAHVAPLSAQGHPFWASVVDLHIAAHLSVLQHLYAISRTLTIGIAMFWLFQAELLEIIVLLTAANLIGCPDRSDKE